MYKRTMTISLISFILLTILVVNPIAAQYGIDVFRGRWDISMTFPFGEIRPFQLYINDIVPDPSGEANVYLAGGCVDSPFTAARAPLVIQVTDVGGGLWDVTIVSTLIDPQGSLVVRLDGMLDTNLRGIHDDMMSGTFLSDAGVGSWTSFHHNRRRISCGDINTQSGLFFQGDVYGMRDMAGGFEAEIFEGFTNIVSAAMRVERPDGSVEIVRPFTDLFSPDVNFVSLFRYADSYSYGLPISGGYSFTLLDVFGDPIPGATTVDMFTGCRADAPTGISGQLTPDLDLDMTWNAVPITPTFDPLNNLGFYQIELYPVHGGEGYGGSGIVTSQHIIPYDPFGGFAPGFPNGMDFGKSLAELANDVTYRIDVIAFEVPAFDEVGIRLECQTRNSSESVFFTMSDGIPIP